MFLLLANFPVSSFKNSVGAIFLVNGQEITSPEILIAYSTWKETSVTIIVPHVDLGSKNSSTVPVLIFLKTDPRQSLTLNYTFTSVLPFVESYSPTVGNNAGGDVVSVKIKYFPYPPKNLTVRFGNYLIGSTLSDSSNQISTIVSFVSPSGISVGIIEIEISPHTCVQLCKDSVLIFFQLHASMW